MKSIKNFSDVYNTNSNISDVSIKNLIRIIWISNISFI